MTFCVLDGSAALSWVLPGEYDDRADTSLRAVTTSGAVVPALWPLEVANVLLLAERRGRIAPQLRRDAIALWKGLAIRIDENTAARAWAVTLDLAAENGLTVYDASYLDVAVRLRLPLATRDEALMRAARRCGLGLVG